MLVLQAVVSYRSVPRILQLLKTSTLCILPWIPHFTSVINWTMRLGLGLLKQVDEMDEPWAAIIDHSIDIGTKKALVVLRVKLSTLDKNKQAIQLKDCECIGLHVSETVNGESISSELTTIFQQAGYPDVIIKDCDRTLNKGVILWSKGQNITIPIVEDIGHVTASSLKAQFAKTDDYKIFTSLTTQGAKKLRQTQLAFLTPPKLRTKGRFQSIGNLGKWAALMLDKIGFSGPVQNDNPIKKLQSAFPDLCSIKYFIKEFSTTAKVTSSIMAVLKNEGLNQENHDLCAQHITKLPEHSKVRTRLATWLDQHLVIQKKFSSLPLLVSSDIIESLFGNFKHIIERSPQADMNRTTLLIPALCGVLDESSIVNAFNKVGHQDIKEWEDENIPYTMRRRRQAFLSKSKNR